MRRDPTFNADNQNNNYIFSFKTIQMDAYIFFNIQTEYSFK